MIIKLHENFTNESASRVVEELRACVDLGVPEITISIDSNGGYVSALQAIVDTIKWCRKRKVKVNTYNAGKAYSCGVSLLSFGDKRTMAPTAQSMIHDVGVQELGGGKVGDLEQRVKELREFNEVWMGFLAKNMKMSRKKLEKLVKGQDLFLSAEESLELGVVDGIDFL